MGRKIKFIDISNIDGFKEGEKVFGHVYKVENIKDGKQHIGHCTQVIGSNNQIYYLGGGHYLRNAVEKHGKENFKKEIIRICYSKESMLNWELIYKRMYNSFAPNGYDILDECESISPMKNPIVVAKSRANRVIISGEEHHCHGKRFKVVNNGEIQKQISMNATLEEGWEYGGIKYDITDESRKKRSEAMKERIKDPNFLKKAMENRENKPYMWITNGIEDEHLYESQTMKKGWRKGRSTLKHSEERRENQRKMMLGNTLRQGTGGELNPRFGKPVSKRTRRKISKANKNRRWITNGAENEMIKKNQKVKYGWRFGRTL